MERARLVVDWIEQVTIWIEIAENASADNPPPEEIADAIGWLKLAAVCA